MKEQKILNEIYNWLMNTNFNAYTPISYREYYNVPFKVIDLTRFYDCEVEPSDYLSNAAKAYWWHNMLEIISNY